MNELRQKLDEMPVTGLIALAYVALLMLSNPFQPDQFAVALDRYGWCLPYAVANGESWRLLTAAFLHGGVVHVAFNLMMLLGIGPALERSLGSLRFLLLYVLAAVGGNVAVCLRYDVQMPVVGGSGALFGMLGAAVALNMRSGRHALAFLEFEGPRRLLGMIFANLVIGFVLPMVSNTAHIGGLITGFLCTLLWLQAGRQSTRTSRHWRVAVTALFASLLFYSLQPVVRFDWLVHAAADAPAPRRAALARALVLAVDGRPATSDQDAEELLDAVTRECALFDASRRRGR